MATTCSVGPKRPMNKPRGALLSIFRAPYYDEILGCLGGLDQSSLLGHLTLYLGIGFMLVVAGGRRGGDAENWRGC
jgi:hypothetical protein